MTTSSSRPPERPDFLDRRVTVGELDRASSDDANTAASAGSRWLEDYRNAPAYVLLGEPGSGKTTAFEMECAADPEGSERVSARDFTELDIASHPEWSVKTLFIDGLDEVRAASSNWRGPLDSIRRCLEGLGHPRFRLSCRAGEWLGEDDADALRRLGSYHELVVLRLDPLNEDEVRTLLEDRAGPARADELMRSAREYGLYGFLQHPLHIELLLEAGMGGGRISGRRDLFESACWSMVREENPAHRAARRGMSRPSEAALLHASGRLCALNLLTDSMGWAVDSAGPVAGYPSIREIENADSGAVPEELDGALRTRLFRPDSSGRFEPMHRQVAEFLAGRFLGDQVEHRNVSPARLRALMAGGDGAPAPSLRGLAAWIAVHSPNARPSLIRRDPVGVASYGDPSEFSPEDQKNLLSSLRVRVREIDIWRWPPYALPSLATPGAMPVVGDIISSPDRDDDTQSLAYLALRAMAQADGSAVPPDLRAPLLAVVRDPRWLAGSRAAALEAWLASSSGDGRDLDEALRLLEEIRKGRTHDPRGSLTGLLLGHLYPRHVTPEQLWDYARTAAPSPVGSGHLDFWLDELTRRSERAGCLAKVLDSLCRWVSDPQHDIDDSCTRDGVVKMFARALERHGDEIGTERLYAWLAVAMPWMPTAGDLDLSSAIRRDLGAAPPEDLRSKTEAWLRERPAIQKALILEIVSRQDDLDIIESRGSVFSEGSLTMDDVLAGAPVADFAPWFLEQAVALPESRSMLACHMLRRTGVGTSGATSSGLDPDEVRNRIAGHLPLEQCLESLLAPTPQPNPKHPLVVRRAREREKWISWVRQRADALGCGEAPPSLYHDIAKAYLGVNPSVRGNTPEERVRSLFLDDEELTRVALDGLRRVTRRTDLPTLNEFLRYEERGEFSYFILPVLAALEEQERKVNANGAHLKGNALQRALGAFFLARDYDGPDPAWYRRALVRDAAGVAASFVEVYRSRIRRSSGVDRHMRALTRDESHEDVARAALPRLLTSFPAKAAVNQIFYLDYLIPAALERVDRDDLAFIVRRKLESASLRIGHRIRWLATGMFLGDPLLGEQLDRFLAEGSDARVRELAAFLRVRTLSRRVGSLPPRCLAMLVKRLGGYFAPYSGGAPGFAPHHVTDAIRTGDVIRNALDALARLPSAEATERIEALVGNEDLAAWREPIAKALDAQRVVRLDAEFEPPTIPEVLSVLKDGRPASSADLAALLQDRISAVGENVRDGDANLWRHFWNEGPYGRAGDPKVESSCRDALLIALRSELPEGVGIESEAVYAGRTNADMQITASWSDFAVPVEAKLSSSRDLWTAITDQLIPRYTRDPRSDGYGVYVVFWHGPEHARRRTPAGKPPDTPDELQDRLTQQLAVDVQRKISVIVLDVSPP